MGRTLKEGVLFIIERQKQLGIYKPSSRWDQLHVLCEKEVFIHPEHAQYKQAVEGVRDVPLMEFILERWDSISSDPDFRRLAEKTVKDSALPEADWQHSEGRDAQFELFVAAVCQSAGLVPVTLEEPDVRCTFKGETFGIAAKRIKSIDQLEKHLKKAAEQIQKSELLGFIALDTCIGLNPENRPTETVIPDEVFKRLLLLKSYEFIEAHEVRIIECVRDKPRCCGIIFHDHRIKRQSGTGDWALRSAHLHFDPKSGHDFDDFANTFFSGLPNHEPYPFTGRS
jgi:hypothetical protein